MIRKIFNRKDFPKTKWWITWAVIFVVLFIPTMMFVNRIDDAITSRLEKAAAKEKKQEIQSEVQRRRVEREKTDNGSVMKPHVSPIVPIDNMDPSTDRTSTESTHVAKLPPKSSDPPSRILPAGPYKGMTPEEVQALEQRKIEHTQRLKANHDKFVAFSNARSQNMNDQVSFMLSAFKFLSPEQLQVVREEALKNLPEEDVELFFNDLENKGIKMTKEDLTAEAHRILASDEALDVVFRELIIEREKLEQEYKELYGDE